MGGAQKATQAFREGSAWNELRWREPMVSQGDVGLEDLRLQDCVGREEQAQALQR